MLSKHTETQYKRTIDGPEAGDRQNHTHTHTHITHEHKKHFQNVNVYNVVVVCDA